jgi:hypothetical protein
VSPPDSTRDVATDDFLYHLARGSDLLQDNRVLEAKEALEKALTMQPADAKGQDLLGAVYFRLGLYPRAIQIYEGLEAQFPGDVSIKVNLALCYLKTGQPEPARRVLRDVVHINPDHKRAWGYLGLALQKLGELEQAQIAFERGGRLTMARKVTEIRRSLVPDSAPPELAQGVREVADAAFSELETGEVRFALAEAALPTTGDEQWHTLEIGGSSKSKPPPRTTFTKTLPPPWLGGLEPARELGSLPAASVSLSAPPVPRIPMISEALPISMNDRASGSVSPALSSGLRPRSGAPPLLPSEVPLRIEALPSGVVVAALAEQAMQAFAARLDAVRVVVGNAATRVLHRRARDADTSEVLGGIGSPFVRMAGDLQLVLGAKPGHRLEILAVDGGLAFVREDFLAGFDLALQYENGRVALEVGGADETPVVQLRGSGKFVLDAPGELSSLPTCSERPLIARREWIVGWFGRLLTRALTSAEAPGGHRGLIGFWGEGTVLVCVG